MASDINRSARIRHALATAGFQSPNDMYDIDFEVKFPDNTMLSIGINDGVIAVARVMPGGHVSGQAVFTGLPMDIVIEAIVAMAKQSY